MNPEKMEAYNITVEAVSSVIGAGTITYPASAAAHAYRVGADITGDGGAEGQFDGQISHARVYSYAVTPQQVKKLYEQESAVN
jgi:hypothetical protein